MNCEQICARCPDPELAISDTSEAICEGPKSVPVIDLTDGSEIDELVFCGRSAWVRESRWARDMAKLELLTKMRETEE